MSEKLFSALALIISIFALFVSVWQGVDSRAFNKLSVKPHLQVNPRLTDYANSGLFLENSGTETAFIEAIVLSVDGKVFDIINEGSLAFYEYIKAKPNCYRESWPRKGAAIQSGREFPLVQVTRAEVGVCDLEVVRLLTVPDVTMKIKYITPYGELLEMSEVFSLSERELGLTLIQ